MFVKVMQDQVTDGLRDEIRQKPPGTVMIADDTAICSESRCRGGGEGRGVETLKGRRLEVDWTAYVWKPRGHRTQEVEDIECSGGQQCIRTEGLENSYQRFVLAGWKWRENVADVSQE